MFVDGAVVLPLHHPKQTQHIFSLPKHLQSHAFMSIDNHTTLYHRSEGNNARHRPHSVEYTGSHLNSEVKQWKARLVLG